MEQLTELKTVLHSKRSNIFYIDKCRIMVKEGRVVYLTDSEKEKLYWNIPIANTTFILLGTGTSISQGAVRLLCSAGVMIGFCGEGGTPLYSGTEVQWLTPQGEYRPTKYLQGWVSFWFSELSRLEVAKSMQLARLDFIEKSWGRKIIKDFGLSPKDIKSHFNKFETTIEESLSVSELLSGEAVFTKNIYKYVATKSDLKFTRNHNGTDVANSFLDHGNYLAYGTAACCLWVLGIPHGFAVMHGKTRRGALVFDVADLVKDAVILPLAFIGAKKKWTENEFRQNCIESLNETKSLDFMFKVIESESLREDL